MAEASAAHAAAIIRAIKASGTLVKLDPAEFTRLVNHLDEPLVVRSLSRMPFVKRWCYLTPYRGLAFYTASAEPLMLSGKTEFIEAKSFWAP